MKLPPGPILSDLDGTLIDSKASVVAAFRWWAKLRGLPEDTISRIPFGRTSTDAAAVLAPELNCIEEGKLLDERQAKDTQGVIALEGAHELLSGHSNLAVVTSCPRHLAEARLLAAGLPQPRILVTPECWSRGKPDPEPYL
jgi:sugar-phosphatase